MKKIDDFLEVVNEGDAVDILSEKRVVEKFNESLKHDLVNVEKDRVILTSKGKRARNTETKKILIQEKQQAEKELTEAKIRRGRIFAGTALTATLLMIFFTVRYLINQ